VSEWLRFQIRSFDAYGGNPEYGRSSTYTFSRLRPLILAYVMDRQWNTPGKWNLGFSILPESGHVELFNARGHLNAWMDDGYENKYTKFTYSSRFGYVTADGGRLDQNVMVDSMYRSNPDSGSLFLPLDREPGAPGVIRTSHTQGTARIDTLIFLKGGSQLRVHRVEGAGGRQVRDGGYTLGHGNAEIPPAPVLGDDWVYMESSVGAVFTRRLLGFSSVDLVSGTGNHSRQARWRLPYADLPSAPGSPFHVAVLHHASANRFDPEAIAARVASVKVQGAAVTVEWGDGDTVAAEFE
jgi:hypothetical protein